MRMNGSTQLEIMRAIGISRPTIIRACKAYQSGGFKALRYDTHTQKKGRKRHLTEEQETIIKKLILEKTPEYLDTNQGLWTYDAVRILIQRETGIQITTRSVEDYLRRWGIKWSLPRDISNEKPFLKSKEFHFFKSIDEDICTTVWIRSLYEKTDMYWVLEIVLRLGDTQHNYGSALVATSKNQITDDNTSTLFFAKHCKGRILWIAVEGGLTIDSFIDFLNRMINFSKKKIFLVVTDSQVHRSNKVRNWISEHIDRIELFVCLYEPETEPETFFVSRSV